MTRSPPARLADRDIVEAYEYMLGRWLVLRQENLDFKEGFKWNQIIHREPGGVDWANPNLDVVYSEAWVGRRRQELHAHRAPGDQGPLLHRAGAQRLGRSHRQYQRAQFSQASVRQVCVLHEGRARPTLPKGTLRINLPSKKSRILMRIELGANPAEAIALQKKTTMKATGSPEIDEAVVKPNFTNSKLPGVEGFDKTEEILASEADLNPGMIDVREKARAIAKAAADPDAACADRRGHPQAGDPGFPQRDSQNGQAGERMDPSAHHR